MSDSLRQQISQHFYNALGVVCNLSTRTEEAEGSNAGQQGELWVYVIVKYVQVGLGKQLEATKDISSFSLLITSEESVLAVADWAQFHNNAMPVSHPLYCAILG